MKRVTVQYFAIFREQAGVSEETLEFDADTVADVFDLTQSRHGSTQPSGNCKVAVNGEMADWTTEIEDGDTVLLFPPVAGG